MITSKLSPSDRYHKILLFLIIKFFTASTIYSQNEKPILDWVNVPNSIIAANVDVAVDSNGDIIVLGGFNGTIDFVENDENPSISTMGAHDIYLQKWSNNGELLWYKIVGSNNNDNPRNLYLDADDNMYITGEFYGYMDLDPGEETNIVGSGTLDAFAIKLDSNGDFQWGYHIGESSSYRETERIYAISTDKEHNTYLVGFFDNTIDFDNDSDVEFNLTSNGREDVFIVKLDIDGNLDWARNIGSSSYDYATSLAIDEYGDVYFGGIFSSEIDFNWNDDESSIHTPDGYSNGFIVKLNASGDFVWDKIIDREPVSLITTPDEGLLVSGRENKLINDGNYHFTAEAYIRKLNLNGELIWEAPYGSSSSLSPKNLHLAQNGSIYVIGQFYVNSSYSLYSFQTRKGSIRFNNIDGAKNFMAKFSDTGEFVWVAGISSESACNITSLTSGSGGELYVTGDFMDEIDLDPSSNEHWAVVDKTYTEAFLLKFDECTLDRLDDTELETIYASCHLEKPNAPKASFACIGEVEATTNFEFPITEQGYHEIDWYFEDIYGELTKQTQQVVIEDDQPPVPNDTNLPDIKSECKIYPTIPLAEDNCDGTIEGTPNVSIPIDNSDVKEIVWAFEDSQGNVSTLKQKVNYSPLVVSIESSGNKLVTTSSENFEYQWFDCLNNFFPIANANTSEFTPSEPGSYSVQVYTESCNAYSDCFDFIVLDVPYSAAVDSWDVFPTVVENEITIKSDWSAFKYAISVYNASGRIVYSSNLIGQGAVDLGFLPQGIYYLNLTSALDNIVIYQKKLIKL